MAIRGVAMAVLAQRAYEGQIDDASVLARQIEFQQPLVGFSPPSLKAA
jgi:hypothetical protein